MNKKKHRFPFQYCHLLLLLAFVGMTTPFASAQTVDTGKNTVDFTDVPRTHPHYTAISYLAQKGVIGGYDDKTFKPDSPINRAEVLKVIINASNLKTDEPFSEVFSDVTSNDWFAPFVMKGKALGFVSGDGTDGHFSPARQVNLAEFLKMLLAANKIDPSSAPSLVSNLPSDGWYTSYVNYAVNAGVVALSQDGTVDVGQPLDRADIMNMMYLLLLTLTGDDTEFLLARAEAEMAQIEVYIAANMVNEAKDSSGLAVDLTQQAYKTLSTNSVILGAAKIARAYDWLVDSFILGIQGQKEEAAKKANEAIDKATEAWEANNATQPIAKHIKDRAREILSQVGGVEN